MQPRVPADAYAQSTEIWGKTMAICKGDKYGVSVDL